jgi:hypothetical protein
MTPRVNMTVARIWMIPVRNVLPIVSQANTICLGFFSVQVIEEALKVWGLK